MKHITMALAAGALAAAWSANPLSSQALDLARVQAVADSLAGGYVAQGRLPGLTVAVAHNGETLFVRGYGKADLEQDVPAGPETVYGITSLTKQLTAASVLRLADAGRLSLDDDITKHLPDFPVQGRRVTVRHL
ncbi:MAG TPA: serine hydrolase domain-containing protein, partial [Longimicrobium sp.]